MKTVLKVIFVLLILGMGFFGFGQSKRVQAVSNVGMTSGDSIWVESQIPLIRVNGHTDILNHPANLGSKLITGNGIIYRVEPTIYASVPADSLFVIPTENGYATQLSLINEDAISISKDMIIESAAGYNNNNAVLEKASKFIETAAKISGVSITLNLPAANIYINQMWDIRGSYPSYSFYIRGVGNTNSAAGATTIVYQGSQDTAILVRNTHHSSIEGINIQATSSPRFTMFVDTFLSTLKLRNVTFRCFGDGCQSLLEFNRLTPNQVSEIYVDHCTFVGDAASDNDSIGSQFVETGISGGFLNNEIIHIEESQFTDFDTAIAYNGPGPMTVEKCNFANNWMDIWGGIGNNTIIGNYTEHCKRFYQCARYSGIVHSILINNDIAGSNPQHVYEGVIVKGAGFGTLINNKFGVATDTTFRIQWDLTADKDIPETNYQTADGLYAVNNFFGNTSNQPGYRWLIDWSFNEMPINGTWGKQVRAWNNRGGTNDENGIDLLDHWDPLSLYFETDTNLVAKPNEIIPVNVTSGSVTVTPPLNPLTNVSFGVFDSRGVASISNPIIIDFSASKLHSASKNDTLLNADVVQLYRYINSAIGWIKESGYTVDNLGSHLATQNISLQDNYLSNDGDDEGLRISPSGQIGVQTTSFAGSLNINGNVGEDSGTNIFSFGGTSLDNMSAGSNSTVFGQDNVNQATTVNNTFINGYQNYSDVTGTLQYSFASGYRNYRLATTSASYNFANGLENGDSITTVAAGNFLNGLRNFRTGINVSYNFANGNGNFASGGGTRQYNFANGLENFEVTSGEYNFGNGLRNFEALAMGSINFGSGNENFKLAMSGNYNVGIGDRNFTAHPGPSEGNIGIGYLNFTKLTSGGNNIGIGREAGNTALDVNANYVVAIGYRALKDAAGLDDQIAIGRDAGRNGTVANGVQIGVISKAQRQGEVSLGSSFYNYGRWDITGQVRLATGTTAQRASGAEQGDFRYNTTLDVPEVNNGSAWYIIPKTITATGTLDFGSTSAQSSADLTIAVAGAVDGDVVVLGVPNGSVSPNTSFTAWVSAANTVTIRFNNYSSGAVDPVSGTFRVAVMKY